MIQLLLVKYWKEIFLVVLATSLIGLGINKIEQHGADRANKEFSQKIDEFNKKLDARAEYLGELSYSLSAQINKNNEDFSKRIDKQLAIALAKNKPMLVQKDNKCYVSPDFIQEYNKLITGDTNE